MIAVAITPHGIGRQSQRVQKDSLPPGSHQRSL